MKYIDFCITREGDKKEGSEAGGKSKRKKNKNKNKNKKEGKV